MRNESNATTLPVPENTLAYMVKETVSYLQEQGLLLTKDQVNEYHRLKRESEDEMLLGNEAAGLLGVTPGMITTYRKGRLIKGYRVGRRWKYSKLELLEFKKRTA